MKFSVAESLSVRPSPAHLAVFLMAIISGMSDTRRGEALSIALPEVFSLNISLPASHLLTKRDSNGVPELQKPKSLDVHLHIFPYPYSTHSIKPASGNMGTARKLLQGVNTNFPGGNVKVGTPAPSPSVFVNFPGGNVQVANGGVHVDWPGGMVNIGKKLMNAQEEITATGRILLETTNVDFPGGNVAVQGPGPAPASVNVNFPGGSVTTGGSHPQVVFPGGSVSLGRRLLHEENSPEAAINAETPTDGTGSELPTSAEISIVLPPYPRYAEGHIPPVNLTAVALLASQILQALPYILTDAVYPSLSRMQAERDHGESVWNSPYNFSVSGNLAVTPTASTRRLIEVS